MIIRRKHTANFTTIGNVLFADERLAADELGIIAFLLSKPNNWEVRRPALQRRFHIGRDSIKRIILNLIQCGWIIARKTRLSNGTFHVVYEVRDEPGPELTPDEARAATSLVSSDAASGEAGDEEGYGDSDADQTTKGGADPPTENPPWSAAEPQPRTGLPATADPATVNPSRTVEDLLKTESVKTEPPNGGCLFSEVQAIWPSDHVISSFACEKLHVELHGDLQHAAISGMKPYLDDCRAHNRKVCDLATYYRERRWERFVVKATASTGKAHPAKPGTPQWYRWRDYYKATNGPWRFMETQGRAGWDFTVPSEWPPALPGKPVDGLTDAEAQEFADTG